MPAIARLLTDLLQLLFFLSSLLLNMLSRRQMTSDKCRHTCRHNHGFQQIQERRESASPTMWKLFLEAALRNLSRGLSVCPTVAPTSCADRSPLRWQTLAVSSTRPLASSGPGALYLTTLLLSLPGKFKQLWRGTIPVPHPTLWSYFRHTYIQMCRQICFCQLWQPDWQPEATMSPDAHTVRVPPLPYKDQLCEVGTFIVLFSPPRLGNFTHLACLKFPSEIFALKTKNNFLRLIKACSCLIASSHPEDV